jgi:hypothetical protein
VTVVSVPARGTSGQCCNDTLSRPGGYHRAWCAQCKVGGNRDHVAAVNLANRALLGRGRVVRKRGQNPQIRVTEHAPVQQCRDKTSPTPSRPRHRDTASGGESEKHCCCTSSVGVGHGQARSITRRYARP